MFINEAIDIARNIQYYWDSSDLETKLKLHKTVFPKGLIHYPFNKDYLTRNVNNFFAESLCVQGLCNGVKQKKPIISDWLFLSGGDRTILHFISDGPWGVTMKSSDRYAFFLFTFLFVYESKLSTLLEMQKASQI